MIVTFFRKDFLDRREYDLLANAVNAEGEKYKLVHLPITKRKVAKGEYGFYINYYVGNGVNALWVSIIAVFVNTVGIKLGLISAVTVIKPVSLIAKSSSLHFCIFSCFFFCSCSSLYKYFFG